MGISTIKEALAQGSGTVTIQGWVYRERGSATYRFIVVRDGTNIIQCIIDRNKVTDALWEAANNALIESSVRITGELHQDERAPTGYELHVNDLALIHRSERYPITKDQSTEFLLDKRHLWIRSREMSLVWKVKAKVLQALRSYLDSNGYVETTPPIITGSPCEGGSELFTLQYYDETAYLSQSAQLYLEALIFSLGKVYALTPSFRAEPSKTTRHLCEYWHLEMEAAWMSFDALLDVMEDMICTVCQQIAETCADELQVLGRDPASLKKVTKPLPRITYDDALYLLKEHGMHVEWGKDLRTVEEEEIMKHYDKPVFVTHYPKAVKAFYMKNNPDHPETVLCCDVLAPEGYGEIFGASERDTDVQVLIDKIKREGEDPKHYEWYLDLRRYGSVQHAGFGLGVERFIRWICKQDTIRDTIPFPRTIKRMLP